MGFSLFLLRGPKFSNDKKYALCDLMLLVFYLSICIILVGKGYWKRFEFVNFGNDAEIITVGHLFGSVFPYLSITTSNSVRKVCCLVHAIYSVVDLSIGID